MRVGYGVIGFAGVVACSNGDSSSPDQIGREESFLSAAACAAVTADYVRGYAVASPIVSPQSYNKCGKSFVVDVRSLSSSYALAHSKLKVDWADLPFVGPWTCEHASVSAIFYQWIPDDAGAPPPSGGGGYPPTGAGHWEVMSEVHQFGTYSVDHCSFTVEQEGLVAGKTYRMAASALNSAGDTRKLSFATLQ